MDFGLSLGVFSSKLISYCAGFLGLPYNLGGLEQWKFIVS